MRLGLLHSAKAGDGGGIKNSIQRVRMKPFDQYMIYDKYKGQSMPESGVLWKGPERGL